MFGEDDDDDDDDDDEENMTVLRSEARAERARA